MKIGICTSIDKLEIFEEMGFDFIEAAVLTVMEMDRTAFENALKKLERSRISVEACNGLLPKNIMVVGPDADRQALKEYLTEAFERVARLGAKYVVFGSPGARRIPDGFDPAIAHEQLKEAIRIAGEIAYVHGFVVLVESLAKKSTNTINTVPESLAMVNEIVHPGVELLADFSQMRIDDEPITNIIPVGQKLKHVHVCTQARTYPLSEEEDCYGDFFDILKKMDYKGRISVEANLQSADTEIIQAPACLALLRKLTVRHGL